MRLMKNVGFQGQLKYAVLDTMCGIRLGMERQILHYCLLKADDVIKNIILSS